MFKKDMWDSIVKYMKLPTHRKFAIWKKLSYDEKYNLEINVQANDLLFFKWMSTNNKQEEFYKIINNYDN